MLEARRDGYTISDDPARLDRSVIHRFLTGSYWAAGIRPEQVERSIAHSIPFGVYHDETGGQIGFARVITDRTTFGYLADVFVLEGHRGRGLARWLVAEILGHPELAGFRRWILATRDAHPIYAAVGFRPLASPDRYMEIPPGTLAGSAP